MTVRRSILPFAAPGALLAVGVALLAGCIPLPIETDVFNARPRLHTQVGSARSDKPVRLGQSTRAQVESAFGLPDFESPDGRAVVYKYQVSTWQLFFPLCFAGVSMNARDRWILLRFDADGALESSDVFKTWEQLQQQPGRILIKPTRTPQRLPRNLPPDSPPAPTGPTYRTD